MQPRFAIVSTPIMRSYTGGLVPAGISTISGFIVTNLDFENLGNNNSKFTTFVVLKVPLEVRHLHGAKRSLIGMYSLLDGCHNKMSPLAPLSSKIRQTLLAPFARVLLVCTIPSMVVHRPLPLTTLLCKVKICLATVLSAIALLGGSEL